MSDTEQPVIDRNDPATWPQTTQVFEPKPTSFGQHQWIQQGYQLIDNCPSCPNQAINIPSGKMLVKERGAYKLVDEITRV